MPDKMDLFIKLQEMNAGYKDTDYLFFNDYPNRSTALRNINRQFNYILNLAGIKNIWRTNPFPLCIVSLLTSISFDKK